MILRYRAKSIFKSDTFLNHPFELKIHEDGFVLQGYKSSLEPAWKDIFRYTVNRNVISIYISQNKAILIPERYLDPNTKTALSSLLQSKVNLERFNAQQKKQRIFRALYFAVLGFVVYLIIFKDCRGYDKLSAAEEQIRQQNYGGAKKLYSDLIAAEPDNFNHYIDRANCEIYLNESGLAVADCEIAISLKPQSGRAYYYYAYALYNDGRNDDACEAIQKSIRLGYAGDSADLCNRKNSDADSLSNSTE